MAELVGYKLINISDGTIINKWGGVYGQCPGLPNPVTLPNGDVVCGMDVNEEIQGYRLDPWMMDAPPPSVPQQVPMWAVRTVLQNDNLFTQAQTAIDASTDNALKNVWEYGNFADRNSKAIASLAATLNLTDSQVDQMFIDANTLEV